MTKYRKTGRALSALILTLILTAGSVFTAFGADLEGAGTNNNEAYVPGELLVMYRDDVSDGQAKTMARSQGDSGAEVISQTEGGTIAVVSLSDGTPVEKAMKEYAADDRVAAVTPNYKLELFSDNPPVNDTGYAQQTYLNQTDTPMAWDFLKTKPHNKVKVAVLDTGADIGHPDLKNIIDMNMSREVLDRNGDLGPLKGDGYESGSPSSGGGHGTHVSGLIAAEANNGLGIAGVGSGGDNSVVDLVDVDVFSGDRTTDLAYVFRGMEYARKIGAKVVNMSLGARNTHAGGMETMFKAECSSLTSNGAIIVCAAGKPDYGEEGYGDNGQVTVIPSDFDDTISVIAVNDDNSKVPSSCYGSLKDVSAPGANIYSTIKGGGYARYTGTSMAAAEVSGIVAMMCSVNPDLSAQAAKSILRNTATDIGAPGFDIYTGAGLVNAQRAVEAAASWALPAEKPLPYSDVKKGDWYYDAAAYMYGKGIMTGLEPTVFGPLGIVSRAQFATILYRMSGADRPVYAAKFPDVGDNEFYTDAVTWAENTGVIKGYENGYFGPSDSITREQMAVMLQRYVQQLGRDTTARSDLSGYPDARSVSSFALNSMEWANAMGIIRGNGNGTLAPLSNGDRAACAAMLMRFMEQN